MLIVAGTITLDPCQRAAALEAFARLRSAAVPRFGCLSMRAFADDFEENRIFVFETWRSSEEFDAHFAEPETKELTASLAACGVTGIELHRFAVGSVARFVPPSPR